MGQFISLSLCTRISIKKANYRASIQKIAEKLSQEIPLGNYRYVESNETYEWLLDEERATPLAITALLKPVYSDYYTEVKDAAMLDSILTKISTIPSLEDIYQFAQKKPYVAFQGSTDMQVTSIGFESVNILFTGIILTIDGKIIMECYGNFLNYINSLVRARYKDSFLCESLRFFISN